MSLKSRIVKRSVQAGELTAHLLHPCPRCARQPGPEAVRLSWTGTGYRVLCPCGLVTRCHPTSHGAACDWNVTVPVGPVKKGTQP